MNAELSQASKMKFFAKTADLWKMAKWFLLDARVLPYFVSGIPEKCYQQRNFFKKNGIPSG